MQRSQATRQPAAGRFAQVNNLINAIPGPLFTTVMDHLFSMGNSGELTLKIKRGSVPPELENMFDNSGPIPRLLDNDMVFTRDQAFKHSLVAAPRVARSLVRDPAPYRLSFTQANNLVDHFTDFDAMEDPVMVMDGSQVDSLGTPTRVYVTRRFLDNHAAPVNGLVSKEAARCLPFPVFGEQALDPPADANHPFVPKYMAYVGNNVLLGAGSCQPLIRTVASLWSDGERSVPLRVTVYDAHPSGRYFTRAADQSTAALAAGVDECGVPLGYREFVARTLFPRDKDVNPDGAPALAGVRIDYGATWGRLFPGSTWLHEPPRPPDLNKPGQSRNKAIVADLVTHNRTMSYRTQLDGTVDGAGSGWYLIDDLPRDPEDVDHTYNRKG